LSFVSSIGPFYNAFLSQYTRLRKLMSFQGGAFYVARPNDGLQSTVKVSRWPKNHPAAFTSKLL
jgi:hypothetical protein